MSTFWKYFILQCTLRFYKSSVHFFTIKNYGLQIAVLYAII